MNHVMHNHRSKTTQSISDLDCFLQCKPNMNRCLLLSALKQVSVCKGKNRTEKIHLRTFLALSLSIPLKNRYLVCTDSWDPGAGSSHPATPSVLHYTQKDVGKNLFMLENQVKYITQAKSKWHPRNIYTHWRSYQAVFSEEGPWSYFVHAERLLNMGQEVNVILLLQFAMHFFLAVLWIRNRICCQCFDRHG